MRYRVTRYPRVFRKLTISQRTVGFWGVTRGRHNSWNCDNHSPPQNKKNGPNNQKSNYTERSSGKVTGTHSKQAYKTDCYRCGMKGHWSRTCRLAKHLVDL